MASVSGPLLRDRHVWDSDALQTRRNAFYVALATEAPDVIAKLRESCIPVLSSLSSLSLAIVDPRVIPKIPEIDSCLAAWATPCGLAVPWIYEDAIEYLIDVINAPGQPYPASLLSIVTPSRTLGRDLATIPITAEFIWRIPSQPRHQFYEMAREYLEKLLIAAMDRAESQAKETGAAKAESRKLDMHMRWLVKRRVYGHRFSEIATQSPDHYSYWTVKRAVEKLAKEIGLPLPPPDPKGRPRKL